MQRPNLDEWQQAAEAIVFCPAASHNVTDLAPWITCTVTAAFCRLKTSYGPRATSQSSTRPGPG